MVIELIGLDFDIYISNIKFDMEFLARGLEPAHALHCPPDERLDAVGLSQDWRGIGLFWGDDARDGVYGAAEVYWGFLTSLEVRGETLDALNLRLSYSLLFWLLKQSFRFFICWFKIRIVLLRSFGLRNQSWLRMLPWWGLNHNFLRNLAQFFRLAWRFHCLFFYFFWDF